MDVSVASGYWDWGCRGSPGARVWREPGRLHSGSHLSQSLSWTDSQDPAPADSGGHSLSGAHSGSAPSIKGHTRAEDQALSAPPSSLPSLLKIALGSASSQAPPNIAACLPCPQALPASGQGGEAGQVRDGQSKKGEPLTRPGAGGLKDLFWMSSPPTPQPRAAWIHRASWHSDLGQLTGTKAFLPRPLVPHLASVRGTQAALLAPQKALLPRTVLQPSWVPIFPCASTRLLGRPGQALAPRVAGMWSKSPFTSVVLSPPRTRLAAHFVRRPREG